ncbi:MAG: penicillin acylase family protein [Bryobacterales bacterium]|nr:penicillin acylase family protein [Bryobacterales bacterium]
MAMRIRTLLLLVPIAALRLAGAEQVTLRGLEKPVEILRDRWGVPHIYAETQHDLFFAQGWITARDRLFQIDLWRRVNNGRLAEVLGAQALQRDRMARLVRFRGDWNAEWRAYSPDAKSIATAFTAGINAYIDSLGGKRPLEFRVAGFDPGKWEPQDVTGRVAGLLMTRNLAREVGRAVDIQKYGMMQVQKLLPTLPAMPLVIPKGLDLDLIHAGLLTHFNEAISTVQFPDQTEGDSKRAAAGVPAVAGPRAAVNLLEPLEERARWGSNNWAVSGALTATGKPMLASDPHRPILNPSLRKTVHLVGPGWNAFGAGEPALPGIALGHNEEIGFGFTIVNIDQGDLYVEKLHETNPDEYWYKGKLRKMQVVREAIPVREANGTVKPRMVELRYTLHGPVIAEELGKHRAFALKWIGAEPGGAGYLGALALGRAKNWTEFVQAASHYKVPSENLMYADRGGNIGWFASGHAPVRKNWDGLLPVPGDTGEFEWAGVLRPEQHPQMLNPAQGWLATANHDIRPEGYREKLGYEYAPVFRFQRVAEMLAGPGALPLFGVSGRARPETMAKLTLEDMQAMQQDAMSIPARRFQQVVRKARLSGLTKEEQGLVRRVLAWDRRLLAESVEAMVFELWFGKLHAAVFGPGIGPRVTRTVLLEELERKPDAEVLKRTLRSAITDLTASRGADQKKWTWGAVHRATFRHPLGVRAWNRGPVARPGDGDTVNATSGTNFRQTSGASFRMVLDFADWDKSMMTNVPGEVGDPESKHYSDLLDDWAAGRYHPMPFTRKAVEAVTEETLELLPVGVTEFPRKAGRGQ